MPAANTTARLEARISTDLLTRCSSARGVAGANHDRFRGCRGADAQRAIEQAEVVRLSLADQESFAQALLSPP